MRAHDRDFQCVGLASLLSVLVLAVGTGCGGGDAGRPVLPAPTGASGDVTEPAAASGGPAEDSTAMAPSEDSASGGAEVSASEDTGSEPVDPTQLGRITGFATFSGAVPKRLAITAIMNAVGCKDHSETPLKETVIVNDGKLQNVFVYISRGLSDWAPTPVSGDPVMLDQKGCLYQPHVVGVRAGQMLLARNSDGISHNVHVIAIKNDNLNKTQGAGSKPLEITMNREEVPVTFVCDIHPWMKAYVCVVDHPFFAVTAADGSFSIAGVPPGDYTVTAWHEKLKKVRLKVTVAPGGELALEFPFVPK